MCVYKIASGLKEYHKQHDYWNHVRTTTCTNGHAFHDHRAHIEDRSLSRGGVGCSCGHGCDCGQQRSRDCDRDYDYADCVGGVHVGGRDGARGDDGDRCWAMWSCCALEVS